MRLKDSSMVYTSGFEQFTQGFHIMQILDIEKNLGFAFLKITRRICCTSEAVFLYIYEYYMRLYI